MSANSSKINHHNDMHIKPMRKQVSFIFNKVLIIVLSTLWLLPALAQTIKTDDYVLKSKVLVDGLNHPWAMTWLGQDILISERNGSLQLWQNNQLNAIKLPVVVYQSGQGGLLDLKTHPNYDKNGWIYLSYSAKHPSNNTSTTALARFRLNGNKITDWQRLFIAKPWLNSAYHFGSRIAFDNQGYVYFSVGDRGQRHLAQQLSTDLGSVIRLHDNGQLPKDNPFKENPAIYSYGHRNPQGMVYWQQQLWLHEHGPRGGDELNLVTAGANYGWPVISYGKEYLSNRAVGESTHKSGMTQPKHYWDPSIAPSGLSVYEGQALQKWQGDLLLGSLKFGLLLRLTQSPTTKKFSQNRIIDDEFWRIRAVYVKDGDIYLLIDENDGRVIQLSKQLLN